MSHQDESRRHHGYEKLCDELLRQNRALQVINLRLLIANEKLLDQVKELQQWQAVSRALDVLPNFNHMHLVPCTCL